MASAKDHKERGNAFYTREEFAAAIKCYDAAIALEPASPALFTNRSAAHFASGDYERSLADANAATALDIKWTKGHYRAGAALVELERYDDAIAAYSRGRDADPSNARVKVGLETAERLKREAPADWRDAKSRGAYIVSCRIVSYRIRCLSSDVAVWRVFIRFHTDTSSIPPSSRPIRKRRVPSRGVRRRHPVVRQRVEAPCRRDG